jgi:hypothetical protein
MNQLIIYEQDNGTVATIRPTEEALAIYGIAAIALKDVPAGKPYKIVDESAVPTDRTFRSAWEVDAATLTDGIGAESNEFPQEITQ